MSATLILLPRVLNLTRALSTREIRREFGGAWRLLVGAALEQVLWLLLGPMLLVVTAGFVVRIFSGAAVGWASQARSERHVGMLDAVRRHAVHMALGAAFAVAAVRGGGWLAFWMAPTAIGLLFSPVLTAVSSRRDLGQLSRRLGLFLTVDDVRPAVEICELQAGQDARARAAGERVTVIRLASPDALILCWHAARINASAPDIEHFPFTPARSLQR